MSIVLSYVEDKNDIWLGLKKEEVSKALSSAVCSLL